MEILKNRIENHIKVIKQLKTLKPEVSTVSKKIIKALKKENKVIFFGNGGSAADSQHLAAEFVGRFEGDRKSLPAIALTTDTSILTAVSNDYGFEKVFERQIQGLANKGDVVIGISTSGNSKNVENALILAKEKGCFTVGLLGNKGGTIKQVTDINLIVNSNVTAIIQECHIFLGHTICEIVNNYFLKDKKQ